MKVEWISTKERQPEKGRAIWRYWPGDVVEAVNCYPSVSTPIDPVRITHWAYADLPEKPEPPKPREWWLVVFPSGAAMGPCQTKTDAEMSGGPNTKPTLVREVIQ